MKVKEFWEKVFYPSCFGLDYDAREERCCYCKVEEKCLKRWLKKKKDILFIIRKRGN